MRQSLCVVLALLLPVPVRAQQPSPPPAFTFQEVMIPMRDGVHLQTVILTPANQTAPLPILFRRTPYGVPSGPPMQVPPTLKELMQDGYIFVIQNLRGRFKSEGVFELTSQVDLTDSTATNETTDAYDSIEWLVHNVPNHNGKVGMYGVSYDGLTTALALLHPHPALKAVSEQASPVDQWMNDDDHRYGALRESYAFEYAVLEQADKFKNTHFAFETYDTYAWYLALGPLSNINDRYLHGSIPYWNDVVAHPDYDEFWKGRPGSASSTPRPSPISTSPGSGIRKTRGDRGRSSATPRNTIPTTRTSWWPVRGSTACGGSPKGTASA
jgi:putative CocE/NonD family hydrolase